MTDKISSMLVTGGAGFIGANFVRYVARTRPDIRMTVIDALTYAGNLANISDLIDEGRVTFVKGDIREPVDVERSLAGKPDAVINFAAESHVDRSIQGSATFIDTNIQGTRVLMECGVKAGVKRHVQVSTDEVYGSIEPPHSATETTLLNPSNPYSASKAGADLLLGAYHHTHGWNVVITRCTNNFGPYQFPEKLIPLMISNALEDKSLPVYGDGRNIRDWIHVEDHCSGILAAAEMGRSGEVYNFGGRCEWENLDVVKKILQLVGKPESLIRYVTDRLGHDRRYSLDCAKAEQELGWKRVHHFPDALADTVAWYRDNESWWRRIKSGEYKAYYDTMYGEGSAVHKSA